MACPPGGKWDGRFGAANVERDAQRNQQLLPRGGIPLHSPEAGKRAQISLLLGSHFGDLETLEQNYLPKPAIDKITIRKTKLEEQRGEGYKKATGGGDDEQAD